MFLAINELSFSSLFVDKTDVETGRITFEEFVKLIKELKKCDKVEGIVSRLKVFEAKISKDYVVCDWINDKGTDRDLKRYALSMIGNSLELDTCEGEYVITEAGSLADGHICEAAAAIVENEAMYAICSLSSDSVWDNGYIHGTYSYIDETDSIKKYAASVRNFSSNCDISNAVEEIEKEAYTLCRSGISSTIDLWEKRDELFPNLVFCQEVKEQLQIDRSKLFAVELMARLDVLQKYFAQKHEYYNTKELGHGARSESDSVKTNPKLKEERKFTLPSGEKVYFFDHFSFGDKRIYFRPDIDNNCCFIGYIGKHLDTAKYKV